MKDYERLTRIESDQEWVLDCEKCEHHEKCSELGAEDENYQYCINRIGKRFAELEDKIESGTLIELPCKVGDTVYWVWEEYTNGKQKLSIEEWEVEKICIEKNEWAVKGLGEELVEGVRQFFWCHSSKFGVWWFLTREEAEKRLKELQE